MNTVLAVQPVGAFPGCMIIYTHGAWRWDLGRIWSALWYQDPPPKQFYKLSNSKRLDDIHKLLFPFREPLPQVGGLDRQVQPAQLQLQMSFSDGGAALEPGQLPPAVFFRRMTAFSTMSAVWRCSWVPMAAVYLFR